MEKYVKVIDGLTSNANGFRYKLDEINISPHWNPNNKNKKETGGFNFSTEDKILRYIFRGDTIYDVIIPDGAEVIEIPSTNVQNGIFRSNQIIITNPRVITEEMVIEYYKKSNLPEKTYYECLVCLLFKNHLETVKYIIKDRINQNNIKAAIQVFETYSSQILKTNNFEYQSLWKEAKEVYDILKEIESELDISLYVSKPPYEKELTKDNIINLAGQSGSGKSYFARKWKADSNYLIVDTDDVFSEKRFQQSTGINKELGIFFRNKYNLLPDLGTHFDELYQDILNYCQEKNKTIVVDCAQFHCIKNLNLLKGKIIIMRTDIDTCYNRCIERYKKTNPQYTEKELEDYKNRKKGIYNWYRQTNLFIHKINLLEIKKEK